MERSALKRNGRFLKTIYREKIERYILGGPP
jgi:hypothetical protein